MFIDFYALLEVPQNVSQEEIKSAYRKQSIKWHPDKNNGIDTTQRMQDINQAYLILKDHEARKRYDIEYFKFKAQIKNNHAEFTDTTDEDNSSVKKESKQNEYTYSNTTNRLKN